MSKHNLIVEGYFDKIFYDSLLPAIGIKSVNVLIPSKCGVPYNGKQNAIDLFNSMLLQLNDGTLEKIAIIVDSDFPTISSQGFKNTITYIETKVSQKGFSIKSKPTNYNNGIFFHNPTLQNDIALWVMPDNKSDGYLEYLLFDALSEVKPNITTEATAVIKTLQNKEYQTHHEMKAHLAVSMAMLHNPGRNISHLIENDIIQYSTNPKLAKLVSFLKGYFN